MVNLLLPSQLLQNISLKKGPEKQTHIAFEMSETGSVVSGREGGN